MKTVHIIIIGWLLTLPVQAQDAFPAVLVIQNNSQKIMKVKIMTIQNGAVEKYREVQISPNSEVEEMIYQQGDYFLKTMAYSPEDDELPIFSKGEPFHAELSNLGIYTYKVVYTVKTTRGKIRSDRGLQITKKEFEKDF